MTNSLFHSVKYKKIPTIKQRIYQRVLGADQRYFPGGFNLSKHQPNQ